MINDTSANSAPTAIYDQTKTIAQAKAYIERGLSIVRVGFCGKKPIGNWGSETISTSDVERYFSQPTNIGIALGERSGNLIDIDIDDDHAAALAQLLLPETGMIFGRKSNPRSHWIYRSPLAKTHQFQGLDGMIIEARSTGAQSVFPCSVHESGELIEFDLDGDPAQVSAETLLRACKKMCIGATLLPNWHSGTRHSLALALAGVLAKSKWDEDEVIALVEAVASIAADDDLHDRRLCVWDTYDRLRANETVEGYEKLVQILGKKAADLLARWAGFSPRRPTPIAATTPNLSSAELKSEARSADRFAAEHVGQIMYCDGLDAWFVRDNKMWQKASIAQIQGYSKRFCIKHAQPHAAYLQPDAIARLESRSRINNIIELAREQLLVKTDDLDCDGYRFGLKDGSVYDLREDQLCDDPDSIVTLRVDANFEPGAECPHWRQFVHSIFDADAEMISFVQRAVGYSLSGDTSAQCMFVLVGSGSNGKSTFVNTIADLLGEYSAATPMKTLMFKQYGNDQTDDLARLVRKRFVSASEGEDGQRLAQAKIKNMTGGEKLSCRALWQNLFEYRPEFKLWLATNSLPDINGADEAVRRRIHIIDFPVKFAGQDRDLQLPQKLAAERSGILNWAIEGYREWKRDGLNPPERVHGSTSQYLQDNDPVGQFIEACCVKAPLAISTSDALYVKYCSWAQGSICDPLHKNTFGKTLAKKGFKRLNRREGTAWKGLGLRSDLGE